jgi:hypothetical protein
MRVLVKNRRMRLEGGEYESIKISLKNLVYVLILNRHDYLLTQPRPHNYREAIDSQNRNQVMQPRITMEKDIRCKQGHVRDFTEYATQSLTHILSNN